MALLQNDLHWYASTLTIIYASTRLTVHDAAFAQAVTDDLQAVHFDGHLKLLLPDGAHNFLEQGASRASGDLYSTILSANDRFNLKSEGRLFGSHNDTDADLHPGIGRIVRLLLFCHYRTERVLAAAAADAPGSPTIYRQYYATHNLFALEVLGGGAPVLFDKRLFTFHPPPTAADGAAGPGGSGPIFLR